MKRLVKSIAFGLIAFTALSCTEKTVTPEDLSGAVFFSSAIDSKISTKALAEGYEPLPAGYTLKITMSKYDAEQTKDVAVDTKDYKIGTVGTSDPTTLTANSTPLYWPGNAVAYAFSAKGGLDAIPAVQNTSAKLISADRIFGYAGTDLDHDNISYKTAKEWKNNTTKVPLYLKHKCAMISVILVAGEGVQQSALAYKANNPSLIDTIFSYTSDNMVAVSKPYSEETTVTIAGKTYKTTKFKAIVEPYNYYQNQGKIITRIVLNNQKYSFFMSNDNVTPAADLEDLYNLEAGEHLELTVTLGRDGRLITIVPKEKDWEVESDSDIITDDFGHGSDPILITDGENGDSNLLDFLNGPDNVKGNIAILNNNIKLTSAIDIANLPVLNATLNLNGNTITSVHQLLKSVGEYGTLKNGSINITNNCVCAVANENTGIIENITVKSSDNKTASSAALVTTNKGEIRQCNSTIKVIGDSEYIGGIVAIQDEGAVITNCAVYGKVCATPGNTTTTLGGIAGLCNQGSAVKSSTYHYGLTINQSDGKVLNNIVGEINGTVTCENNSWPTVRPEVGTGIVNSCDQLFDAVIDCESELGTISSSTSLSKVYRIADSFVLSSAWGNTHNFSDVLDGNGKTIHTNGTAVFNSVSGNVSNLNVMLDKSIIETSEISSSVGAFAIMLDGGVISSITTSCNNPDNDPDKEFVIRSSNPAGIVAMALNGSIIRDCINNVKLEIVSDKTPTGASIYAGGIVSQAEDLTISGCINSSKATILSKIAGNIVTVYTGGIVGGLGWLHNQDTPSVVSDCICFTTRKNPGNSAQVYMSGTSVGGLVGFLDEFGVTTGCIGNWWQGDLNSVGLDENPVAGVEPLGAKNAVTPLEGE